MWKGSVSSVIETAAEKGQLNDWLMALVPVGRLHVNMWCNMPKLGSFHHLSHATNQI